MFAMHEPLELPGPQTPKVTEVIERLRDEAERRAIREAIAEAEASQFEVRLHRRRSDPRFD